jgi:hypothetical protein
LKSRSVQIAAWLLFAVGLLAVGWLAWTDSVAPLPADSARAPNMQTVSPPNRQSIEAERLRGPGKAEPTPVPSRDELPMPTLAPPERVRKLIH